MDSKTLTQIKKYPEFIEKSEEIYTLVKEIVQPFLTFDEAYAYLKLSPSQLKKLCEQNLIPYYKPNRRKAFFIKERLISGSAPVHKN
jgi:hypothetical protein